MSLSNDDTGSHTMRYTSDQIADSLRGIKLTVSTRIMLHVLRPFSSLSQSCSNTHDLYGFSVCKSNIVVTLISSGAIVWQLHLGAVPLNQLDS